MLFHLTYTFTLFFIALVIALSMSEGPTTGLPPAYVVNPSVLVPVVRSQCPNAIFELLIIIIHLSKCMHTPNQKTKNTKPVLKDKGPFNIPIKVVWPTFLGIIAEKLTTQPSDLIITTLI
jgi:hypothetical protein